MPAAYRIVRAQYAGEAFNGEGARLYGGRWNDPGTPVVYTSASVSLCTLEMLVHLRETRILAGYVLFRVDIPDGVVSAVDRSRLPANWSTYPAPHALALLGSEWLRRAESIALEVPSAVVETESNFLLNPAHPDFAALRIDGPFPHTFDPRLV
jgi:RES domain-containing protein